jgi:hypothetical protein
MGKAGEIVGVNATISGKVLVLMPIACVWDATLGELVKFSTE